MSEFPYDAGNPGPCCQKIEDMLDYARPIIQRWPPFHKYTLGEEIMREIYTMLRLATKARLRYMNKSTLADLDTSKAILDVYLRQANRTPLELPPPVVWSLRSGLKMFAAWLPPAEIRSCHTDVPSHSAVN